MRSLEPHVVVGPQQRGAGHRRTGSRVAAAAAYLGALALVIVLSRPVLFPARDTVTEPAAARVDRPAGIPATIPAWAWKLNAWHETGGRARGERPAGAPRPLPAWYWKWHAWRVQVRR